MQSTIKTFEDACSALGLQPVLPDVSALPEQHQKAIAAHYKLVIIAEALNNGWKPDWQNMNEYKYYPWFDLEGEDKKTGSGRSYDVYGDANANAAVGSRLCFKTSGLAKYAGTQFEQLYADYFLLKG